MTETGKVAIAVAVIGALSAIGAKLVEVRGKSPPSPASTAPASVAPPSTADAPAAAAAPAAAPAATAAATLAGTWTDKDGDALVIEQSGATFTVTRWSFAGFISASGTLTAGRVALDYRTKDTRGNCTGTLSVGGDEAVLACDEPGNSYRQVLRRAG